VTDKAEAGRTCANWKDCGKHSVSAREKLWCSFECRDAALNPAPSPVERCSCEESVALRKALGFDTPWPVTSVLEKLADAAKHLLRDHDCDRRGWESVDAAEKAAREIIERIDIARRALALGGETET